jgi:3-oxoacyl-[acyl-carrier protein] reductase
MSKLSGKVAVVTGASKGIGAAIARHLGAAGASVVVNYSSSKEGADRVVDQIKTAGGKAVAVQADVSKKADVDRLFAEASKAFGRLDILVNNAGIYSFSPLEVITEEHFHSQFNLNVLGLILATQKAVEAFGPEGGSVINIGSVVGIAPVPGGSVYSATKAAVDALTKAHSRELGPKKIRVNSLNPGMVETEGVHAAGFIGTDFQKSAVAGTPLGRLGQPDDIATVAVFLASDDAGWLTGQTLFASGGAMST